MTTTVDYAALAAYVYNDQRGGAGDSDVNTLQLPAQWREVADLGFAVGDSLNAINPFSFTGGAYLNQATGEIVVAYKGTDFLLEFSGRAWNTVGDMMTNAGLASDKALALGLGQQLNAMAYYLAVKDWAVDSGYDPAKITFTGHSLGGGLAANMAVWFDKPATTFASAPFENTTNSAPNIEAAIVAITAQATFSGSAAVLDEINRVRQLLVGELLWQGEFDRREAAVTNIYNEGEFLQYVRMLHPTVVGTDIGIDLSDGSPSLAEVLDFAVPLHSMNLHAAFLFEDRLRQLTKEIPELLPTLLDKSLFAVDPNSSTKDLVTYLVNDQLRKGFGEESALTRFTTDIDKLKSEQGVSADERVRKALIALAMDYHYNADPAQTGTLFTFESGAIHFDLNDINADSLKGLGLLKNATSNTAIGGDPFESQGLQYASNWHVQTGGGAMNWQADTLANDAALGGDGADVIRAGGGEDILLGGAGDDILDGGTGGDTLLGGTGTDTYKFTGSFGKDTILDADGLGQIEIDGVALKAGKRVEGTESVWLDETKNYRITRVTQDQLLIAPLQGGNSILVKSWKEGDLGITLGNEVEETPPPEASNVYLGDQRALLRGVELIELDGDGNPLPPPADPTQATYAWDKTTWLPDGTLQGGKAEAGFADVITAAGRSDSVRMEGLGGNDLLVGGSGADDIDGGADDDLIFGGAGADHILGGDGNDTILSAHSRGVVQRQKENDAFEMPTGAQLRTAGPTWATYNLSRNSGVTVDTGLYGALTADSEGDFVDAGAGDDLVTGSNGADTIRGGAGKDSIWGMGGGDLISGGDGDDVINGDGTSDPGLFVTMEDDLHGADIIDGGSGDDLVIGQGGSDYLLGGAGDDEIWGDNYVGKHLGDAFHGNDVLLGDEGSDGMVGGGGDDQLYGGEGDDTLYGDDVSDVTGGYALATSIHGADELYGGEGNDFLVGGGGDDRLEGEDGDDVLYGDGKALDASAHGDDYLNGGAGDDILFGEGGKDRLFGGEGDDTLHGDSADTNPNAHGDDYLEGGAGNDFLYGEGGNDTLDGGSGANRLEGGAGDDIYVVRTADVSVAAPGEGAQLQLSTVISDTEGKNTIRIDALRSQMKVSAGANGVGLTWDAGADGMTAGVFLDDYASVGTFTLVFSNGERLALSRLMGDEFESPVNYSSNTPYAAVVGGKSADNLSTFGNNATLSGGKGDDIVNVDGADSTVLFDRGDGRDSLRGYGTGTVIAFGPGIQPNEVFAKLLPSGTLALGFTGSPDDEVDLGVQRWELDSSEFIAELRFSDGSRLALADVLTRGVDVLADANASDVFGTNARDRFAGMPDGAQLWGGEGDDTYAFGEQSTSATIDDSKGRNVLALGGATTWGQVSLSRVDEQPNDLLLTDGTVSIRLVNALLLADRFETHLATGEVQSLEAMISSLGSIDVSGGYEDDVIVAGALSSDLSGDHGNDRLFGGNGDDLLDGGAGNDLLNGGAGSDFLFGGAGDDTYEVDFSLGEDEIVDIQGRNAVRFLGNVAPGALTVERLADSTDVRFVLEAGRSVTVRRALEGAVETYTFADGTVWTPQTLIDQTTSPDGSVISGDDLDNTLNGTSGGDFLAGRRGNDTLFGHAGNDEIQGGEGNDLLIGGAGEDLLSGGEGEDTYQFNLGDGVDQLVDMLGLSKLRFGAGISPTDLVATRVEVDGIGHVRLAYGANDAVLIQDGVQFSGTAFEFSGGKQYTAQDLFSQVLIGSGTTVQGTTGDDTLYGYASADTLLGDAGFDVLNGGAGNDTLDGGADADELVGGSGVDTYVLSSTGGHDRVAETPGQASRLQLVGIALGDLSYARLGADLLVMNAASDSSTYIRNAFTSGTTWTLVDAQGTELSLMDGARSELSAQDAAARKTAFAHAVKAQAGPADVGDEKFSTPGSRTIGVGTSDERILSYQEVHNVLDSNEEEVTLVNDGFDDESSQEYLGYEVKTTTYVVTDVEYQESIALTAGRVIEIYPNTGYSYTGSSPSLFHDASTGRWYLREPDRVETFYTPVYSQRTVTENYYENYYRTTIVGTRYTDEYIGGDGDNHVTLEGSATKLISGGAGNDLIERASERLVDDEDWGAADRPWNFSGRADYTSPTSDWIDGGAGDDRIYAGLGNDEVSGGTGNDYIDAGAGSDTYLVDGLDDGWDVLYDSAAATIWVEMRSTSYYGPPLDSSLKAALLELISDPYMETKSFSGNHYYGYDVVAGFVNVNASNLNALLEIDRQLLAPVLQLDLESDSSILSAVPTFRSIGLDRIIAQTTGNPFVDYGMRYIHDDWHPYTVFEFRPEINFQEDDLVSPVVDTIRFGEGVFQSSLTTSWSIVDTDDGQKQALSISWGSTGGVHVVVPAADAPMGVGVEQFEFADGSVWSMQEMLLHAPPRPVHVSTITPGEAISTVEVLEDASLSFQIPVSAFMVDGGAILHFELHSVDRSVPVPSWVQFDTQTGMLSGTPPNDQVGDLQLEVTAVLTDTQKATQPLTLRVINTNDAPEILGEIEPIQLTAGDVLTWSPLDGKASFEDVDMGDRFTVDVRAADSGDLPSWLSFNALTGELKGQPDSRNVGTVQLLLIVRDLAGAQVEKTFSLQVNDAPTQILYGSTGDDVLSAGALESSMYGRAGNDNLTGSALGDTLDGGVGDDVLNGGAGSDTYLFGRGDGHDRVHDQDPSADNLDAIIFKAGVAASDVQLERAGDALVLKIIGTTDQLQVENYFGANAANDWQIEEIRFTDDPTTVWNVADIIHRISPQGVSLSGSGTLQGTDYNDTLTATYMGTHLIGGAGDDILTSTHSTGYDYDHIYEGGTGNDTLEGGYARDTYLFNRGDGQDTITDDVRFYPNAGAPNYFTANPNDAEYQDRIKFGAGITADQLWFRQDGNSLEVSIIGTDDRILINGWYDSFFNEIEEFELADGQMLLNEHVNSLVQAMAAFSPPAAGQTTLPADLQAALGPVIVAAWAGIELQPQGVTLSGSGTLQGTDYNDTLTATYMGTHLIGGAGDDILTTTHSTGYDYDHIYEGGTGNDTLEGGYGKDTYLFNRGDGQDTITDDVRFYPNAAAPNYFAANPNEASYQDRIIFGAGITADQLWFRQDGNSLEVSIIGTDDKILINGWYDSFFNEIEEFELADGQMLLNENVNSLVQAMAAFSPPAAGQTTLTTSYATDLTPVISANWQ
jgi:Ca2+-binding RTX toxin-like protein